MRIRVHENMSELKERYVEPLEGDLLVRLNDEFLFDAEGLSGDIRVNVFLQDIPECTLADGVLSARTTVDFLASGDVPADMEQVALATEDAVLEELRGDLPEGVSVEASGEPRVESGNVGRGYTWRLRRDYNWNILIGRYLIMDKRFFDGQNLAAAFEDLGVTPWLEMEIETSGVTASSNGIEY